jgi:CheY-like chemotaxis protein
MRILFADDSMTAQNMGKKILTDAGYEVVAVSNGAAAVKKIAEQKPDIIILDIYMPGYTGLEVCDKIRGSAETFKTPVLLTVGKMEPYRPEDANRVKADGVIIKPFEASDLLAVIKKLEERVVPKAAAAITEQTVLLERTPELEEFLRAPSGNHTETPVETARNSMPAMVDVPDNMANAAAFSDLLGSEAVPTVDTMPLNRQMPVAELSAFLEAPVPSPVSVPVAPDRGDVDRDGMIVGEFTGLAPEDVVEEASEPTVAPSWNPEVSAGYGPSDLGVEHEKPLGSPERLPDTESEEVISAPIVGHDFVEPAPTVEANSEPAAASLPVVQPNHDVQELEPQEVTVASTSMPAEAAETITVSEIPAEMLELWNEPQPTVKPEAPAAVEVAKLPVPEPPAPVVEPELVRETAELDSFSVKVETQIQQIETIVAASEARQTEPEVEKPSEPGLEIYPTTSESATRQEKSGEKESEEKEESEDDFEARVAAAMSAYEQPDRRREPAPAGDERRVDAKEHPVAPESVVEPISSNERYSFEYAPPITSPEFEPTTDVAASTEIESPVDEIPMPRAGLNAPVDEILTPGAGMKAPVDEILMPGAGMKAPVDDEIPMPEAGTKAPVDEILMPGAGMKAPVDDEIPIPAGTKAPVDDEIPVPEAGTKAPVDDEIPIPEAGTKAPVDDEILIPGAGMKAPVDDEILIPGAGMKAPVDDDIHLPVAETPNSLGPAIESVQAMPAIERENQVPTPKVASTSWPLPADSETIISEIKAQVSPAPVGTTANPGETQMIASVVHRVLERLRPQLIEEISRELKSQKEPEKD